MLKFLGSYKIWVALAIVTLGTSLAVWRLQPASPAAYYPNGPGEVYLALGDSLAWGARLEKPQTESYPALLEGQIAVVKPIELVNLAVPGETSVSFIRRQLPQALALIDRERQAGRRVSPITLDIGGNDLRNAERGTPEQRYTTIATVQLNLAHILDELRQAAGNRADIAVMTYYNPYGGDPAEENSEAYWVTQLNTAIRSEAEQRGMVVADTYAAFDGGRAYSRTFILIGDIHANRQGHEVIAEQFWLALGYPVN
ncbi:MAG: SGNH/GDSL hydrolase family protein [Chloroflexales bacterium]|nr:SGNH/GDSL hydrolase family protein [Chloroflexales bacterium]